MGRLNVVSPNGVPIAVLLSNLLQASVGAAMRSTKEFHATIAKKMLRATSLRYYVPGRLAKHASIYAACAHLDYEV